MVKYKLHPKTDNYVVGDDGTLFKKVGSYFDKDGYECVSQLHRGTSGNRQQGIKLRLPRKIHRLVMQTFDPIVGDENMQVDHINGIKDDNRLENLRWCTPKQNTQWRSDANRNKSNHSRKAVVATDCETGYEIYFESQGEAGHKLSLNVGQIGVRCKQKFPKPYHGYLFRYATHIEGEHIERKL